MISFLNYRRHPDKKEYKVFYYRNNQVFEEMKTRLTSEGISFEELVEDDGTATYYVIIHENDFDEAQHCNAVALTTHKQPLITDPALRYFLIILFLVAVGIAVTGYIISNF